MRQLDTQAIENPPAGVTIEASAGVLSVVSAQWKRTPRGCFIGATDTNQSEQEKEKARNGKERQGSRS